MLVFDKVSFQYGKRTILKDLSFTLHRGECLVLAGENGAGKSTATALAAGILKPASGTVTCAGRIGYAPQGGDLLADLTVEENLKFFASLAGGKVPKQLDLPIEGYLRRRADRLSGGMRKQVSLLCADLGKPEFLLLDEPCAGLDTKARARLLALVGKWKAEGRGILYVGHDPEELEAVGDRRIILQAEE